MTTRLRLICSASTTATRAATFAADDPVEPVARRRFGRLSGRVGTFDAAWTSPASGARETALALGLPAVVEPMLGDWDHGRWAGRPLAEIAALEPDAFAQWVEDPAAAPHGGESLDDVLGRAAGWLAARANSGGRVVAVTHAPVIRAAVVAALRAPPLSFWHLDVAPLCAVTLTHAHGRWRLSGLGALAPRGGQSAGTG